MARLNIKDVESALKNVQNQLTNIISDYQKMLTNLVKDSKTISDNLKDVTKGTSKELIEVNKALESQKKINSDIEKTTKNKKEALTDLQKVEQQQIKVKKQIISLQTKEGKALQANKLKLQEVRKEVNQSIKSNKVLSNAYLDLKRRTANAQFRFKTLQAQFGETSIEARKAGKEFNRLNDRLSKINKNAKDGRPFVGQYSQAFGKLGSGLSSLAAGLGVTAGLTALVSVVKNSISIFSGFEKANSSLQAVLGASNKEMDLLKETSRGLGSITEFTAKQVVGLQTEFAKLGFPVSDIQNLTASTLDAASAMESDLAATAKLTGATLKAFRLDASEAERVNNVLSVSTVKSALDFEKLSNSMSTIAPVANSFGFSLEGTVSLLGDLSNAGFDASSAATATRNIMLNLADASSKLGKRLKEPVKDIPSLVKGLKQLKGEGVDLAGALELTDKRSVAAFSTFLEGTESITALNDELTNLNLTAKDIAEVKLDNLAGDVTKLGSAWEGFVLSLEDGDGRIARSLRSVVQGVTSFLSSVSDAVRSEKELADASATTAQNTFKESVNAKKLLEEYESLTEDGVEPTIEEKIRLNEITQDLQIAFGDEVIEINKNTGALELNKKAVEQLIAQKAVLAEEESRTAFQRIKALNDLIKQAEDFKLPSAEETVAKRLPFLTGDLTEQSNAEEVLKVINETITSFGRRGEIIDSSTQKNLDSLKNYASALLNVESIERGINDNIEERDELLRKLEGILTKQQIEDLFNERSDIQQSSSGSSRSSKTEKEFKTRVQLLAELEKAQRNLNIEQAKDIDTQKPKLIESLDSEIKALEKILFLKEKTIDNKFAQADQKALNQLELFRKQIEIDQIEFDDTLDDNQKANKRLEKERELIESKRDLELENQELTENERLLIIEKSNAEIIALENDRFKQIEQDDLESEKRKAEARKKITEDSLNLLGNLYQKFQDNQIKAIGSEINQSEKRLTRLNDAVNAGVKGSAQALAQEEARREKLEQDKREAEKRRVRTEAFIAGAKLLVQNDGDIISTSSDIKTLETIARSLTGFKDGTDNTGYKSTGVYDSQGEVMGVVHKGETVLTEGQRKELSRYGINSRSEIVQMAKDKDSNKGNIINSNNKETISELREVRKEIKKLNKEIKVTTNIDSKYVTSIIEREKWKESNRKKSNVWG